MMIKDIIDYYKYRKILRDVYDDKSLHFVQALNASFGVEFRRDTKHERLYAVINPYIQNMSDGQSVIYDGDNKPVVEKWVMDNFLIIEKIIHANDLFDIVHVEINQLDEDLNYSIVLQNILFDRYVKCKKNLLKIGGGILLFILILLAIFI